jgi:hypothetical protein
VDTQKRPLGSKIAKLVTITLAQCAWNYCGALGVDGGGIRTVVITKVRVGWGALVVLITTALPQLHKEREQMSIEVEINGMKYVPVNAQEAQELGKRIREFSPAGKKFWKERFERDSQPGALNEGMYSEGDETAPFFSEAFLYNLLGKEDARSVLGILRRLSVLAGVEYR